MAAANDPGGLGALSGWMIRKVYSERGIDLGRDSAWRSRVEDLAARAIRRYDTNPAEDIRAALTWGPTGSKDEVEFVIPYETMRAILGRESNARLTATAAIPVVPSPPRAQPPTLEILPSPPPKQGTARGTLFLVTGGLGVGALVAGVIIAVMTLARGDGGSSPGNGADATPTALATEADAAATATPTPPTPPPTATFTPTTPPTRPPPTPTPVMRPGRTVSVANTEPDPCLYLRPEPDRSTAQLTCLLVGTTVRLLSGPEERGGIIWWFVEVLDYQGRDWQGYAAEREAGSETAWLVPDPAP